MPVVDVCQSYFHGFQDVANYKNNDRNITALAILKIISYFTVVIPLVFAVIYGAASLCGRVSKKEALNPNDTAVSGEAQKVFKVGSTTSTPGQPAPTPGQPATTPGQPATTPGQPAPTPGQPAPTPDSRLAIPSSVVLSYTGDLTQSQKSEMKSALDKKTLRIIFEKFPTFDVTIRCEDLFKSGATVIVNAANTHLGGGTGIDGKIHKEGGRAYQEAHKELQKKHRSEYLSGEATLIASGSLKEKHGIQGVIVVAGPFGSTTPEKENQLYSCYYNSLRVAHNADQESIAFPSISTGAFAFPKDRAAQISLKAIYDFVNNHPDTTLKTISIHFLPNESDENLNIYHRIS